MSDRLDTRTHTDPAGRRDRDRLRLARSFGAAYIESSGESDPEKVAAAAVGMADAVLAALKQE